MPAELKICAGCWMRKERGRDNIWGETDHQCIGLEFCSNGYNKGVIDGRKEAYSAKSAPGNATSPV